MAEESPENTELRERVVRLETTLEHHKDTTQSLSERVTMLEDTVKNGFAALSTKIDDQNKKMDAQASRRAMFIAGGSGAGGGIAVGLYSLAHLMWGL